MTAIENQSTIDTGVPAGIAPMPALTGPRITNIPLLTGTGRMAEKMAIDALAQRGVTADRILYVCNRNIVKQMDGALGVETCDVFGLAKKDLSGYAAVMLGDMFPEERKRAFPLLQSFEGLIVNSVACTTVPESIAATTLGSVLDRLQERRQKPLEIDAATDVAPSVGG